MQCHGWSSSLARRENISKPYLSYLRCSVSLKLTLWAFPNKPQNEAEAEVLWPVSRSFLGILVSGKETYLKAKVATPASTISEFKVHLTTAAKPWDTIFGISEDLKDEDMYYLGKQHVLLHTSISYDLILWVKYSNYFSVSSTYCFTSRNFTHLLLLFKRKSSQLCQHLSASY